MIYAYPKIRTSKHCPSRRPIRPPSHSESKESKCDFKRSRLFCSEANGDTVVQEFEDPGLQVRSDVARLEVCHEDCSDVLHDVSGLLHARISPNPSPVSLTFGFNGLFRIIDELGREVCQRQISVAMDITPPSSNVTDLPIILNIPFSFKCCDKPRQCDSKTTYRLQVEGIHVPLGDVFIPFIKDVTWSAIVWEN